MMTLVDSTDMPGAVVVDVMDEGETTEEIVIPDYTDEATVIYPPPPVPEPIESRPTMGIDTVAALTRFEQNFRRLAGEG